MTAPTPPVDSPFAGVDFSDHRGGVFYLVGTRRVHESELTPADVAALTALPAYASDAPAIEQRVALDAPTPALAPVTDVQS